jgi:hypothetical protein
VKRGWFAEFRMLWAERLILLALRIAPDDHPHSAVMARHMAAMATETLARLQADRRLTGEA